MMSLQNNLFHYSKSPLIYVYSALNQPGLKVGYTARVRPGYTDLQRADERIREGLVRTPNKQYKILWYESAITKNGKFFMDHDVHRVLVKNGHPEIAGEFYDCNLDQAKQAINEIKYGIHTDESQRNRAFAMRPEQQEAVNVTSSYFTKYMNSDHAPHFLWNAKMRFGKTFTAYELARKMDWKRILVLTYKPATEQAWHDDLVQHIDFIGWQFVSKGENTDDIKIDKPLVWFDSYQDVLGRRRDGGTKKKHKLLREIEWDCLIVDEYHFGAWRDTAKSLSEERDNGIDDDSTSEEKSAENDEIQVREVENELPITAKSFLYLSGTPFRALANGEFTEDQIFNWTYADEQNAKRNWRGDWRSNPYADLPQVVMMTYQMPDSLREIAKVGEFNEFDLNKLFAAKKLGNDYVFERESDVQKFLNILRGVDLDVAVENRFNYKKPAMPYEDARLLSSLRHTLWFMPGVNSCYAMKRLLENDPFYSSYKIICAAGNSAGMGIKALDPVKLAIGDGLSSKTITLTCSKLTTGVTVKQWSGVLFLRNTSMPETYFQAAFRAQSPWVLRGVTSSDREIVKSTCYLLDFAPSRALRLLSNYSNELASVNDNRKAEVRLQEFVDLLPVLCYDGISMTKLNADEILDISTYGTASTMLAKRWQNASLVDVTNITLEKVLNSPDILAMLEKFEQFRGLQRDLSRVISSEKALDESKKEKAEKDEPQKLTDEEQKTQKENRGFKKQLREKLLKFIMRIPVFMYLTDYREERLIDVIRNLEPDLFTKTTGLTVRDFDRLCEVGVFNYSELNSAIFQFRRFEDSSLTYLGGRTAAAPGAKIGGFDTTATAEEIDRAIEQGI